MTLLALRPRIQRLFGKGHGSTIYAHDIHLHLQLGKLEGDLEKV